MGDNNIGAMARQMAQKADITTPKDSATIAKRIQHVIKDGMQNAVAGAIKALANMSQIQEPTDSTTREITWPGMKDEYSGPVDYSGDVEAPVTHTHTDFENGQVVGQQHLAGDDGHWEGDVSVNLGGEDVTLHYEGEVPKEK